MDVELARKFMLAYLPADAQIPMSDVFEAMKANPAMVLNNGLLFNQFNYFQSDDKKLAIAASNGVVVGFALALCMHNPAAMQIIQEFVELNAKSRGENVVNFLERRKK